MGDSVVSDMLGNTFFAERMFRPHFTISFRGGRLVCVATAVLLVAFLGGLAGCNGMTRGGRSGMPQSDRLMARYDDLSSGRFTVIADFESDVHQELFRSVSAGGDALHRLDPKAGVPRTGGGCLRVAFSSPDDQLVADGSESSDWNLPRDWREYHLLLMAIHASVTADLQLSLVSGRGPTRSIADAHIPLQSGWNLLRLDLADAAEHVALDDIREVTWSLPDIRGSTVLLIDDIVLVDNESELFGDPDAGNGGLYLRRRGRRWELGASGRFELGLLNGQIKHWYDLGEDRLRVRNLVEGAALGPTIVAVEDSDEGAGLSLYAFPSLGDRVVARQRVLEATSARIVVECQWDFVSADTTAAAPAPGQRWTYTVYPDGMVYVHIECTTETPGWSADSLGLAVSRRLGAETTAYSHSTSQLGDSGRLLHLPYAFIDDPGPEGLGLVFAIHDGRSAPLVRVMRQPQVSRVTAVAFGGETLRPLHAWDCLLALGDLGANPDERARQRAMTYCFPPPITPSLGSLKTDSAGDGDQDGFDEQSGCYMLEPDGNRVRFVLDGVPGAVGSLAFVVHGSAGRDAWVYVDHEIHNRSARNATGEVVFGVPLPNAGRRIVEVFLRNPDGDGPR